MEIAHIATFDTSLPDDVTEKADETITPGGSTLGESIAAELRDRGLSISIVQQRGDTGWGFFGSSNGVSFWCLLGYEDPWVLIVVDRRWLLKRLFGGTQPFLAVLRQFDEAMSSLEHITELHWITPSEYEYSRAD